MLCDKRIVEGAELRSSNATVLRTAWHWHGTPVALRRWHGTPVALALGLA